MGSTLFCPRTDCTVSSASTTLVAFSRRRTLPSVWLFLQATDHQITRKPSLPVKELW